jgi:hypothetical protein
VVPDRGVVIFADCIVCVAFEQRLKCEKSIFSYRQNSRAAYT